MCRCKLIILISFLMLSLSANSWAVEFHLVNGDKVTGEPVSYDGRDYQVKNEYGELSIPAEKVATIFFNWEGGTVSIIERPKGIIQDTITGKIEYLQNGEWKISAAYGDVFVRLGQIKQIITAQVTPQQLAEFRPVVNQESQMMVFYLTDGDKVSGEPVSYKDKTYRVKSEYGELSIPAERVLSIFANPATGIVTITEQARQGQDLLSGKIASLQNGEWKITTAYGYIIVKDFEQISTYQTIAAPGRPIRRLRIQLRSQPGTFSLDEIKKMVQEKGFRDSDWNPDGDFPNEYEVQTLNGDKVVIDSATGLMWQQSGSLNPMLWEKVTDYINQLNQERYAGFSDWRLPTIEELASLLEPTRKNGSLYVESGFDTTQQWCWSADKESSGSAWVVSFSDGSVGDPHASYRYYVRRVRSRQ